MRTVDCPSCGAHFALPEDLYNRKVAGKKTKVRCKVCGERLALDGTSQGGVEDLWVVSVGDDDRELSTSQVTDALKSGEIGAAAIVWKEGMDDWAAVDGVEHFAPALEDCSHAVGADTAEPSPSGEPSSGESGSADTGEPSPSGEPSSGESGSEKESEASTGPEVAAAPRVPELFAMTPGPEGSAEPESEARIAPGAEGERLPEEKGEKPASEVETAPAAPVATRPTRADEMHALFTIESLPPAPIDLDDSDMKSMPPSDVPPLVALRARGVIPRAPRAPLRDLIGDVSEGAVLLAPPSVSALLQVTPDPAESESVDVDVPADEDVDIPVDEDIDIPVEQDATVPETLAAKRAQAVETKPRRRGLVVVGVMAALIVGLGVVQLRHLPAAPDPERSTVAVAEPDRAPTAPTAPVVATAASPADDPSEPAEAVPTAEPRAERRTPSKPSSGSVQAQRKELQPSLDRDSDPASPAPSSAPREPKPTKKSEPEAASGGNAFDKGAAIAALTAAAAAASSCRRGADPSGTATVLVTFAPSGRVTSANLSGPPFAGTATGGCIAAQMRSARVPRFSGSHVTVSKRVVIH